MKTGNAYLPARLASRTFRMADLFTITLISGTVIRLTSADITLNVGGFNFAPAVIKRTRTRMVLGIEVDTMTITLSPGSGLTVMGNPLLQSVHAGAFDGAEVLVERIFMETWGNTSNAGIVHVFEGAVSRPTVDGARAIFKVKSMTELLNVKMPRNLFLPSCGRVLYGNGCGVNRATYATGGLVVGGSTKTALSASLAQAAGYFDQGYLIFNSGPNSGVMRTVKKHETNLLHLALPLAYTPQAGDTFTVYPGCDKTLETCESKFNNKPRFRGFKWIPVPETAY